MADPVLEALDGIAETLGRHTGLLERIVQAATEEPPKSEMPELIKALIARLEAVEGKLDTLLQERRP